MSCFLPLREGVVPLQRTVEPGGIVVIQSAEWKWNPAIRESTTITFFSGSDRLFALYLNQSENVCNLENFSDGSQSTIRPLEGAFVTPAFSITVCNHGDDCQILFSFQMVFTFSWARKPGPNITGVSYWAQSLEISPLSGLLVVSTYVSLEEMSIETHQTFSEIRPVPHLALERSSSASNVTTKATFRHGVGPIAQPGQTKKDRLGFEYAEHCFLGDAINLSLRNGQTVPAKGYPFRLSNDLCVTYGEINGLAGDFYGTYDPISDGSNQQQQSARFRSAYGTLSNSGPRQPKEAMEILKILQKEVDAVNEALHNHEDPSVAYSSLPDETAAFEKITFWRSGIPGYLGLAAINWDHFGPGARTAYNTGHGVALDAAVRGELEYAYTLNAFADHFLEDSFSAGHLRTPRRGLHARGRPDSDLCAKYMHDEDCAIGLSVQNQSGERWTAYGDKRLLDAVNEDNKKRCLAAVQASAGEIYDAWRNKTKPDTDHYKAWSHAPTLESAESHQVLAPLFRNGTSGSSIERRTTIKNRRDWKFTNSWWYWSTLSLCQISGWWKYPITIDGPQGILPQSAIAATTLSAQSVRVFFQDAQGGIRQAARVDGRWSVGASRLFQAKLHTPLAVINYDSGREIRVYCLSDDNIVQEYCWSEGTPSRGWYVGSVTHSNIRVASNSSIAAIYVKGSGFIDHRLYCQDPWSNEVLEYTPGDPWRESARLSDAQTGSSIAAVAWSHDFNGQSNVRVRVYFQALNFVIMEYFWWDQWFWELTPLNPGRSPRHSPITALVLGSPDAQIRIYWHNGKQEVMESTMGYDWQPASSVLGPSRRTQISATHSNNGEIIRLYYQGENQTILEHLYDGRGWATGKPIETARSGESVGLGEISEDLE